MLRTTHNMDRLSWIGRQMMRGKQDYATNLDPDLCTRLGEQHLCCLQIEVVAIAANYILNRLAVCRYLLNQVSDLLPFFHTELRHACTTMYAVMAKEINASTSSPSK